MINKFTIEECKFIFNCFKNWNTNDLQHQFLTPNFFSVDPNKTKRIVKRLEKKGVIFAYGKLSYYDDPYNRYVILRTNPKNQMIIDARKRYLDFFKNNS